MINYNPKLGSKHATYKTMLEEDGFVEDKCDFYLGTVLEVGFVK